MLSKEKCLEKSREYLRDRHPQVWERLSVTDDAVRVKVYDLLAEYLQESAPELSDNGAFQRHCSSSIPNLDLLDFADADIVVVPVIELSGFRV
jgi:hypothetical protein